MLRAGSLRRRVAIQYATETRDSYGAVVKGWVASVGGIPAMIVPKRGDEKFVAGADRTTVVTEWKMRNPGVAIDNSMRLVDEDGVVYDIEYILPSNTKRELVVGTIRKDGAS